ncbi:MAG: type II toxin-antitoxin system RelE/ParE family toxin [Candidatus Omnitrophica bacterium]|nr:type II toxin-antitoxin system RelE/ParE family toxin [Candidatus Omnitrophota bacterium]MBU4478821.1 type II toxin-antitoxin system RelE/ParE family toxin [Candidatus Omnitrophota bacterium]
MWQIKIHPLVLNEDFKKISEHDRSIILKTIHKKLCISPEKYGSPLRSGLKGYWKLKISHYRVVYKIDKNEIKVLVLKIGMRRDEEAYKEMLLRIRKL